MTQHFKVLRETNYQPRVLYSAEISFTNFQTFSDEGKLKEFIANSRSGLGKLLKKILHIKGKWCYKSTWNIWNKSRKIEMVNTID